MRGRGRHATRQSRALLPLQEAKSADGEIHELRENQQDLSEQLEEGQVSVQEQQSAVDTLEGDVDRLLDTKQQVR